MCNGLNLSSLLNWFGNHQKYYQASVQNLGAAHLIKQLKAALA